MRTRITILLVSVVVLALATKATTARTSNEQILTITQPDALDIYIERLEFAESSGREDIVILDSNGKHSYGCLQFQESTWELYTKKYGGGKDIMDCAEQRRLAKNILLSERDGWRNWTNSVARIGRPPAQMRSLPEASKSDVLGQSARVVGG
jgi:hypothetical protein